MEESTGVRRNAPASTPPRALARLGLAGWATIAVGAVVALLVHRDRQVLVVALVALFFGLVIARLMLAATIWPRRRSAISVLSAAILLWAIGSLLLNARHRPDFTRFPANGEWFFILAVLGMAAYLILDASRRPSSAASTWLEATVLCGGTTCVAAFAQTQWVAHWTGQQGAPLLLALVYPFSDLALLVLIIGQVSLRVRPVSRQTVLLLVAFVLFGWADTSFAANLDAGMYHLTGLEDLSWGIGFALLTESACGPRRSVTSQPTRRGGTVLMMAAALAATLLLAVRPATGDGAYLAIPAVITVLAACARLVVALQEANGAAAAVVLSRTDDLTLLPNRRALLARLDEAVSTRSPVGLMMLDLDGFKDVNDTLGHAAGDVVLQYTAQRMRQLLPSQVLVSRLGGDEFALLLPVEDAEELARTAEQVLQAVCEPLTVDGIEFSLNASLGITTRMDTDAGAGDLLRRADVAMYRSKTSRSGPRLYDPTLDEFSREKLQLADELRKGIAGGQLVVWYQPQVEARTGKLSGVEALVRWQHPDRGLLLPGAFLPAARRAGLMLALSESVAGTAMSDLRGWRRNGWDVNVSLNCAPAELLSGMFLPWLFEASARARLPRDSLILEITEDAFLSDPDRTSALIADLRAHALQVSIDDYGTGFSSLAYLRDLPVQELKMDRSFIEALGADSRSRMIVDSTVHMAHALGLRIVAEGVEDARTAAELMAMGVDTLQGFYVAKPMPAAELLSWRVRSLPA